MCPGLRSATPPPPSVLQRISLRREARRATAGDVLIFRGQVKGATDTRAVAHRSPDMHEGQRRLVLTADVGNLLPTPADAEDRGLGSA